MNPELQRQLWLKVSRARLIAVPLIIALLVTLVGESNYWDWKQIAEWLLVLGMVFSAMIGAGSAAESMLAEIQLKTWDWQRLSSLGPWQLTWGKLAGSAVLPFYGGAFCYAGYAVIGHESKPLVHPLLVILFAVLLSLLAQAVSFLIACCALYGSASMLTSAGLAALALISGVSAFSALRSFAFGEPGPLAHWYGFEPSSFELAAWTTAAFLGWALLGSYRVLRAQLQYRDAPWAWLAFVGFTALYFAGLTPNDPLLSTASMVSLRALVAHAVVMAWAYAAVFASHMEAAQVHRVLLLVERHGARHALRELPAWSATIGLSVLTTLAVLALPTEPITGGDDIAVHAVCIGLLAILVRDSALIFWFRMRSTSPHTNVWLLLIVLCVHVVAPAIFTAADLDALRAPFSLLPSGGFAAAAVLLGEAALAFWLVRRYWVGYSLGLTLARENGG